MRGTRAGNVLSTNQFPIASLICEYNNYVNTKLLENNPGWTHEKLYIDIVLTLLASFLEIWNFEPHRPLNIGKLYFAWSEILTPFSILRVCCYDIVGLVWCTTNVWVTTTAGVCVEYQSWETGYWQWSTALRYSDNNSAEKYVQWGLWVHWHIIRQTYHQ